MLASLRQLLKQSCSIPFFCPWCRLDNQQIKSTLLKLVSSLSNQQIEIDSLKELVFSLPNKLTTLHNQLAVQQSSPIATSPFPITSKSTSYSMAVPGSKTSTMAASGIKNPDIPNSDGTHNQIYSNSEKRFNIIVFWCGRVSTGDFESYLTRVSPWSPLELTLQLDLTPSGITSGWGSLEQSLPKKTNSC